MSDEGGMPYMKTAYAEALRAHLEGGKGEESLERAYELGREAIGAGLGIIDMLEVHRAALASLGEENRPTDDALTFLSESLSSFEMVHRGYRDALRASEARFRRLAESGIVGIVVTTPSQSIVEVNDAFAHLVGRSTEKLLGTNLRSIRTEIDEPQERATTETLAKTGVAQPREQVYARPDRTSVAVLAFVAMLEGDACLHVMIDLSERKRAELALLRAQDQLRQAQKMDAIGKLAGGVAHDFNNLLSVILSYTELLTMQLAPEDPMAKDLHEIHGAGKRAAELTHQLLAFSRQQVLEPRTVALNDIVTGSERLLRRLIGEDIDLTVMADSMTGLIHVDPSQIEQVILNLAVNARDAMPRGGKLTIETSNVKLDEEMAKQHDVKAGRYVVLVVTDTGTGMDAATQARMFEPFFSTKELGKGTGLGLATVYGIVHQSGGSIWVYSELGTGTTFKVFFPRADGAATSAPTLGAAASGGHETILLVEDEGPVRIVARAILTQKGYTIIEAKNGEEALKVAASKGQHIDLLLTDVIMPRMSGRELSERLRALRPEMKVLFMSGYTPGAVVQHGVLDAGTAFIQKPITPDALARKVREVLDEED